MLLFHDVVVALSRARAALTHSGEPNGVVVLGATGSVGASTLNVIRRHADRFRPLVLTANRNWRALDKLADHWSPEYVVLASRQPPDFAPRWHGEWRFGPHALVEAAAHDSADVIVNAVVGVAGLEATISAVESGKRLALANKESLVAGGSLVVEAARRGGGEILPVDSEHSAIHQCLAGTPASNVARITLTASGGALRDRSGQDLLEATAVEALAHPTWDMGQKVTVDSATLANKALEVIEAHWLFELEYDRITAVVHPTSIVHSIVEFRDGSAIAQMSRPSMEIPVLWALSCPARLDDRRDALGFDPLTDGPLEFLPIRRDDFPLFGIGVAAGRTGGELPAAFNAANEVAAARFLAGDLRFGDLRAVVEGTVERFGSRAPASVADVREIDSRARRAARGIADSRAKNI